MTIRTFLQEIEEESGQPVSTCYQCYRCSNGCPAVPEMDLLPHQVMRHIVLGNREKVLESTTPWACVQCAACSVRCPNDIHIAHVFETLRRVAVREGKGKNRGVWKFDELFLESVRKHGRLYELETLLRYKAEKGRFFEDIGMGAGMLAKGRMGLLPHNIRGKHHVRRLFERVEESRKR